MRKLIFALLTGGIIAIFCFSLFKKQSNLLETYDLEHFDIYELLHHLESEPLPIQTAIYGDYLEIADERNVQRIDLPDDLFYLSIAPYEHQTHPCSIHFPTSCQGEMSNETFDVEVVDQDGKLILKEKATTYDNGFFPLWLPKNIEGTIKIEKDGKTAVTSFQTYKNSDTCMSHMKLRKV